MRPSVDYDRKEPRIVVPDPVMEPGKLPVGDNSGVSLLDTGVLVRLERVMVERGFLLKVQADGS